MSLRQQVILHSQERWYFAWPFTALSSQLSASGVRLAGPAFQLGCLGAGSC